MRGARNRERGRLFWLLAMLLLVAGCERGQPPLYIGANIWPGYEFLFLADQLGFYAEEGANVRMVEFLSLGDSRRAFERGQVDLFAATPVEVLVASEQSAREVRVFYATSISLGPDVIMAAPQIGSVAELRGRRVAIEPGTLDILLLYAALAQSGLTLDDVVLVPMAQAHMPQALQEGLVDAVAVYPPESIEIEQSVAGCAEVTHRCVLFDSGQVPGLIIDMLVTDRAVVEQRGGDLAAVARAFDRAVAWALEYPQQAHALMAQRQGLSADDFVRKLAGLRILRLDEQARWLVAGNGVYRSLEQAAYALGSTGVLLKPVETEPLLTTVAVPGALPSPVR